MSNITKECNHSHCSRCSEKTNTLHGNKKGHICCTKIEHLSVKTASEYIIEDINLHIHCGELTAIIGRNGAGKTTFLRTLLDEVPHTGEIHFMKEGKGCTSKPKFGYVPQRLEVAADSPVSVGDFVLSCLTTRPVWLPRRKKDRKLVSQILSATSTEHLEGRRLCELSGGELQRVLLALAINPVPDILLLDEPVSGVDRAGLSVFYELVSELRHSHDITILLISHDLDLIGKYADKVVLIDKKIVAQGKSEEVYSSFAFAEIFGATGGIE